MTRAISLFSGYSQGENRTTNYCLLLLKMLYEENRRWIDGYSVTTAAARARSRRRHTIHCALNTRRGTAGTAASHRASHAWHHAPSGSGHETSAYTTGSACRASTTTRSRSATCAQQPHAARYGSNSCRRNRANRTGDNRSRHCRSNQIRTAHLQRSLQDATGEFRHLPRERHKDDDAGQQSEKRLKPSRAQCDLRGFLYPRPQNAEHWPMNWRMSTFTGKAIAGKV